MSTSTFQYILLGLLGCILYLIFWFKLGEQRSRNAAAPRLAQTALVVSKRQYVGGTSGVTSTAYYVTFEFVDRRRCELCLSPEDYGLLVEGDTGTLHSQGDWFKGFDRR
jgi:Protein of unknown function (DUF2500)